ncbi:heme ABC transporter permease CcmC [Parvularcula maris]|uniref:Heme exporter protein C n=1 Tax=Parvularcula maris TaxID=2965077 RepID=A0A9X2L7I6_9PROT|nr:heme ABC transporter permease CcmC [Parvularcula maris]MCQ8184523.1 heme ABC transporter permease CcmC [Parvularcula maris]
MANPLTILANPDTFKRWTKPLILPIGIAAVVLLLAGSFVGLFASPPDFRQGESVRIMYVHVPAAWMALQTYALIAGASLVSFIWRHRLADVVAREMAPLGLLFTLLAIATGALWGKVTWGVFWDWDARMTSMLVLAFLYAGYIAVWQIIDNDWTAAKTAGILAMLGAVNLPIIKFSVDWWDSLHQKATVIKEGGPSMPASMLLPLFLMAFGYIAFFGAVVLMRSHTALARKKAPARKVSSVRMEEAPAAS